jgi:hypothetical protein
MLSLLTCGERGGSNGFCWFRPIFYNEQFANFQPVNCIAAQKNCKIILSINHKAFLPFSLCINQSGLFISHVESMELKQPNCLSLLLLSTIDVKGCVEG